jgi:hypothetical protein
MAYLFKNHYEYRKHLEGHDEDLDHDPRFKEKLDTIVANAKTILLVGWRWEGDKVYDVIDYLTKFAQVTLVEAYQPNCDAFVEHNRWNYPVEIVCADIVDFIQTTQKTFDVCIWQDGPEHVAYERFITFLDHAFKKIDYLTISTPNGIYKQDALYGNQFEIHVTTWYEHNYTNLDFDTALWLAHHPGSLDKNIALMGVRRLKSPEVPKTKNLFVYPNALIQTQDKINEYWNTIPMCIEGQHKHFNIVTDPQKADLFFMGMISCGTVDQFKPSDFPYLQQNESKHIFELEGDWVSNSAPEWLAKLAKSGNSSKPEHLIGPLCVRPAVSNLLAFLAKNNPEYDFEFPDSKTWAFRGFPDPFGVRARTVRIMQQLNLPGDYGLTNQFGARQALDSDPVGSYCKLLHANLISVCPRGAGIDSIRFYETCFFGRVPVAISDAKWLGEDHYDMSFAYRLSPSLSDNELAAELTKINDIPYEELVERGKKARQYFQEVVIPYFQDPTLYFINFLKRKNIIA